MRDVILIAPTCKDVGLRSTALAIEKSLKKEGKKALLLSPFARKGEKDPTKLPAAFVERLLSEKKEEKILDHVVGYVAIHAKKDSLVLIEGFPYLHDHTFASHLNNRIGAALSARVIFVTTLRGHKMEALKDHLLITKERFSSIPKENIIGYILNKAGAPVDGYGNTRVDLFDPIKEEPLSKDSLKNSPFPLLGIIPWERLLMSPNPKTIEQHLKATPLNQKAYKNPSILHFILAAATVETLSPLLKKGVMILTSGDRSDIIIATCMAYVNGIEISGLVLTGGHTPSQNTLDLCKKAMDKGLPILSVETDSLRTSIALQNMTPHSQEKELLAKIVDHIAKKLDMKKIAQMKKSTELLMSPTAFRYHLIEKAKSKKKTIVLPEGDDIRIINAANACMEKKIAKIVLLGQKKEIEALCKEHNTSLHKEIVIQNPATIAKNYIDDLVAIRKHKGMTEEMAKKSLTDPIVVGMMMLEKGEVDGLVAGANTTTANVVSPALKILKTAKGAALVSSIFFMCLPTEVVVYGDCAVNLNPTAEELANIAIQSAASAKQFDIDPKVAMISYSTGSSGFGEEVEKVKKATKLVQEQKVDFPVDGPLQYDAAGVPDVAKIKAPKSKVAGKATVFIFPDLNTANTTYKAVQRTAGVLSIGPVLQGLKKPVNDLSRGATVDDIIYTIAITAIQDS
ncbi:phosphate acetyltransferase [bacterium]|nr:phosphate acetyltransferase [bacterium]